MLDPKQISLLAEIDDRIAELSALLSRKNNSVLQHYGVTDSEMVPMNRRSYFKALHRLEVLTGEQIIEFCATQFSTTTSGESVLFLLRHRWMLGKCLMRLRITGIRHFYFPSAQAALDGLAALARFSHFVAPLRAVEITH